MKASVLYRVASILIALFAAGHTLGFRKTDPAWQVDTLTGSMRSIQFQAQGFTRSYYDFFTGFGLFVSILLFFAAVLAWQLGGMPAGTLAHLRGPAWMLALCFVAVTALCWRYFFWAPILFSAVIALCLLLAAWRIPGTGQ